MAAKTLEHLLQHHPAPREELAVLDAWRPAAAAPRMQRAVRMEEAFGLATFGQVADWRDKNQTEILGLRGWTAATIPLYRVFFLHHDLESYREAAARWKRVGAMTYRDRQQELGQIESSLKAMPRGILTSLLLPALGAVDVAAAEAEARQRLTHLALAAHRYRLEHGDFPETVGELETSGFAVLTHDPFTGELLQLVRRNGAVVLYSFGPNQADDGGAASEESGQGDLVFILKAPPDRSDETDP
jgi:hypothetical protein